MQNYNSKLKSSYEQGKKTLELIEEKKQPQALIIGHGIIANYLVEELGKKGCQTVLADSYLPSLGKFDYIFQFGHFPAVERGMSKHLEVNGKFLFIDNDESIFGKGIKGIKTIKTGDLSLANPGELVNIILKTMFSKVEFETVNLVNNRKFTSGILRKINKQTIPFKPQMKPVPKPQAAILPNLPIVQKTYFITVGKIKYLFLIILLIFFSLAVAGYLSFRSLEFTVNRFKSDYAARNWSSVSGDVKEAKKKIGLAKTGYKTAVSIFFPLKKLSLIRDLGETLEVTDKILTTGGDILDFSKELQKKNSGSLSPNGGISKEDISYLKNKIISFQTALISGKRRMDEINLPYFPKTDMIFFMSSLSEKLTYTDKVLPLLDAFLIPPQPRVYMLLFQNNMELRPTGGFIGSFGLLTVSSGRIADFQIYDVYQADGQLKGHVDPPLPIRKYLSQPHYFLRDSNFDPDFAVSAGQAVWFLQKELGKNVDGVIGMNLFVIQKMLQSIGPLKIADFGGEEINADNFFLKAQTYSQDNFFPGSTQKRDFLMAVANTLMNRLTGEKSTDVLNILPVITQLLDERNLLIYTNDENIREMIEKEGWGGRMGKVACVTAPAENSSDLRGAAAADDCYADYLSINEANLGVNKANYFISKSVTVEKTIEESGKIANTVTLSYENSGTRDIYKGVNYTAYIRIFVPLGSQLVGITLNNAPLPSDKVDTEKYMSDKMSFGFLVTIAQENIGIIKVSYTLPRLFDRDLSSYQLLYQKQGGDKNAPLVLSITFPSSINLKAINFNSTASKNNEIYYSTDTSVDRVFAVSRQ